MATTKQHLLEVLVDMSDQTDEPIAVDQLSDHLDADSSTVLECLQSLESSGLIERSSTNGGYSPTVTGRELLALDPEATFIVIENPNR